MLADDFPTSGYYFNWKKKRQNTLRLKRYRGTKEGSRMQPNVE